MRRDDAGLWAQIRRHFEGARVPPGEQAAGYFLHLLKVEGFPQHDPDTLRLLAQRRVVLRAAPIQAAYCHWLADGRAVLSFPEGKDVREWGDVGLEEVGHDILRACAGVEVPARSLDPLQRARMLRREDGRDERGARDFLLAWKLPYGAMLRAGRGFQGEEYYRVIAAEAKVSVADVRERQQMVLRWETR